MNPQDAISSADIDGGDYVPVYRCEDCGAEISTPGLCDTCEEKLDDFRINGNDPRR